MKSLAELQKIREEMQGKIGIRHDGDTHTRVVVGMDTCGIAAGARSVLQSFMQEIEKRGLTHVAITQTGCIGLCQYEPIVEVYHPGEEKVTYIRVTPDMVPAIVARHLVDGIPVQEYTIGAADTVK